MIIKFEPVFKWEVVWSATQACLEQEIPFRKCQKSNFRCTYERKVWHVRHWKLEAKSPSGLLVMHSITSQWGNWHLLEQLIILPPALPCLDSQLEQHHYHELDSLRRSEVLFIWEPSRRCCSAAAYNVVTSWTLLSSQSRPPSWCSRPSPGPHWSVACSLKAHCSETQYVIKWQHLKLEYYAAADSESISSKLQVPLGNTWTWQIILSFWIYSP